jgi:hypothetical protein
MRKLLIAGLAVAFLTGNVYGQVAAPTVTPMPWEPNPETLLSISDQLKVQLETALRVLRESQDPATPPAPPTMQGQPPALAGVTECALREQTTHPVNARVRFNGGPACASRRWIVSSHGKGSPG